MEIEGDISKRYKESLLVLKGRAFSFFDQMRAFDLNFEEDQLDALRIAERLIRKIQDFFQEYLEKQPDQHQTQEQPNPQPEKNDGVKEQKSQDLAQDSIEDQVQDQAPPEMPRIEVPVSNLEKVEDLELATHLIKNCREEGIIGKHLTMLALKNQNSFLIATNHKGIGIKLYEGGVLMYKGRLKPRFEKAALSKLNDMIYIPDLNCYIFIYEDHVFRQDIDFKGPYLYIKKMFGGKIPGVGLTYSAINKRLIGFAKKAFVINLFTRGVEMEIRAKNPDRIMSYSELGDASITHLKLVGEGEDRIIVATDREDLIFFKLDYVKRKVSELSRIRIMNFYHHYFFLGENITSIEVSQKSDQISNQYVLVKMGSYSGYSDSKDGCMIVLKVKAKKLTKKAMIKFSGMARSYNFALRFFGCVGKHVLWVGLKHSDAHIYDFNSKTKTFRELEEKSVSHRSGFPPKMYLFEGRLYYAGISGEIFCLRSVAK